MFGGTAEQQRQIPWNDLHDPNSPLPNGLLLTILFYISPLAPSSKQLRSKAIYTLFGLLKQRRQNRPAEFVRFTPHSLLTRDTMHHLSRLVEFHPKRTTDQRRVRALSSHSHIFAKRAHGQPHSLLHNRWFGILLLAQL